MAAQQPAPQGGSHPLGRSTDARPSPPHILIRPPTVVEEKSGPSQDLVTVVTVKSVENEDDAKSTTSSARSEYCSDVQQISLVPGPQSPCVEPSEYPLDGEGLPTIEDDDLTPYSLQILLRKCQIKTPDMVGFWTLKALRRIFSRARVRAQINEDIKNRKLKLGSLTITEIVDAIIPPEFSSPQDKNKHYYTRVYALLVLCEKSHKIVDFMESRESDMTLPLVLKLPVLPDFPKSRLESSPHSPVQRTNLICFNNMKDHRKSWVEDEQWKVLTPYFDLDANSHARHMDLPKNTILPWCERKDRKVSDVPSARDGGYGFVSKVKIHPTSHGFQRILSDIQLNDELFALKQLRLAATENDEMAFRNELDNLNRFSGLVHDHLVTLLATFTLRGQYYFLFPYAECALDEYWEKAKPQPHFDLTTVRWVSKQMFGIMGAVDTIHEPKHVNNLLTPEVKRYGRHGDIKPDNILWFKSHKDPLGILVVSDMGLTSFNRDVSRSNIPGNKMPGAPGYRPPECEVIGGKVSRAFDIWTLGCLFLELTTWLMGGWELVEEFEEARLTPDITGSKLNIFFDLKEYELPEGGKGNVAQVKAEVTKVST